VDRMYFNSEPSVVVLFGLAFTNLYKETPHKNIRLINKKLEL
jgi:hypothetical protein